MKNKQICVLLMIAALTGCQSVPSLKPTVTPAASVKNDSWNGMHLDLVQFLAEENKFTCLAPSGVDFAANGQAFKKTLCFKIEQCETTTRIIYLEAHSMLVTATEESIARESGQCTPATNSGNTSNIKPSSR